MDLGYSEEEVGDFADKVSAFVRENIEINSWIKTTNMVKKVKIVRGRTPYITDAESILSVRSIYDSADLKYTFNYENRRLSIIDVYERSQDYLYGKEYRVEYIVDLQLIREEKIKEILK